MEQVVKSFRMRENKTQLLKYKPLVAKRDDLLILWPVFMYLQYIRTKEYNCRWCFAKLCFSFRAKHLHVDKQILMQLLGLFPLPTNFILMAKASFKWAPPSEFVSSSIPSWQILTAHAQPFRGARNLAFCLKVPLDSLLVWASSEGSGETARMRRLAWTFAARIGDKYQIRLTRSKCINGLHATQLRKPLLHCEWKLCFEHYTCMQCNNCMPNKRVRMIAEIGLRETDHMECRSRIDRPLMTEIRQWEVLLVAGL